MTDRPGFLLTAEEMLERPTCEALVTKQVCDLYGSAFQEEQVLCHCKSTLFYLGDGEPLARCAEHPLDEGEYREQWTLTFDEYRVAQVMQS